MKRLLVLTALAAVTASSSGCWHWFNRGGSCGAPAAPACGSTYGAPVTTYGGDPYMAPPGVAPPAATYVQPGPVGP